MKTIEPTEKNTDLIISEVRAIKRQVVAEHCGNLDAFFDAIRKRQSTNPRLVKKILGEQDVP
jgi:hypothetical protein